MRTCFVHIGTHKTGTTSLQLAMSRLAPDFRSRGYLYASTGRPAEGPHGHHNLAWEMTGDWRFRREHGTLGDLLREIASAPMHVVLSSEDFESCVEHVDKLSGFVERLRAQDLRVTLVIYIRNQIDYATSLYATLLNFGLAQPFEAFAHEIVRSGRFAWREWVFAFDYDRALGTLERLGGIQVVARSYDAVSERGLFADFFEILGLDPATLEHDPDLRAYRRPLLSDLLKAFVQNRQGRALDRIEGAVVDELCRAVSGSALAVSPRLRAEMADAFRESNRHVCERYLLPPFTLEHPATADEETGGVWIDSVFSDASVARLGAVAGAMTAEVSAVSAERDSLLERVRTLEQEIGGLKASVAQLSTAGEALQRERDALTRSTSWKATAPLRRLRGWIR
jgi:hypothetical protein